MSKYLSIIKGERAVKNVRGRTCCFTGHRQISWAERPNILRKTEQYARMLIDLGVIYFGVGGALGFDTLTAELLFKLRE